MNVNWKAGLICMATGAFCTAFGYIVGHACCVHRHVDLEEVKRMLQNEDGTIDFPRYIKNAFKDYKRVKEDPCGFKRGLD